MKIDARHEAKTTESFPQIINSLQKHRMMNIPFTTVQRMITAPEMKKTYISRFQILKKNDPCHR